MLKYALTFVGGILLGVAATFGAGILLMKHYETEYRADTYAPDWMPDFSEEIYESAAELAAARSHYERWIALGDVALWSVDAGFHDNAQRVAEELILVSDQFKDDWNYGNSLHKAHLTLGRLAFRKDDIPTAIEHLREAGKTPGSPQLDTFGPNMTLAFELLKAGETEAVLEYFDLCEEFWELGGDKLAAWRNAVRSGEIPRFGANLVY